MNEQEALRTPFYFQSSDEDREHLAVTAEALGINRSQAFEHILLDFKTQGKISTRRDLMPWCRPPGGHKGRVSLTIGPNTRALLAELREATGEGPSSLAQAAISYSIENWIGVEQ